MHDWVRRPELADERPLAFVVGAFAHGKIDDSYVDEYISISQVGIYRKCAINRKCACGVVGRCSQGAARWATAIGCGKQGSRTGGRSGRFGFGQDRVELHWWMWCRCRCR